MSLRDVYIARMEAQLMGWGDELAWLKSEATFAAERSSAEFHRLVDAASVKHQAVRRKFEGLKKSGHDLWGTLAVGVEVDWRELST